MIAIAFALITIVFALIFTKMENKNYKTFFLFITLLFSLLTFASFKGEEIKICVNPGVNYCLEWKTAYYVPGLDAIIYGLGMVILALLAIWLIEIVLKGFEHAI